MTILEQIDYAHKCLNRMLEIEERITCLDKERDKELIESLRNQSLQIQRQADQYLLSSVS